MPTAARSRAGAVVRPVHASPRARSPSRRARCAASLAPLAGALLGSLSASALAADRTVGPGRQYADVDDALAAAANGDRVLVYAGTYTGNYIVGRVVELRGVEPGVVLTAPTGTVLTIQQAASGATVIDLTLSGGSASNGGAARVARATAAFDGVTFQRGRASIAGGGLHAVDSALTIHRSTFLSNSSGGGGGGLATVRGTLTVTDTTFTGNTSTSMGGGAVVNNASVATLSDCTFEANTSTLGGGGLAVTDTPALSVVGAVIRGNDSGDTGGGYYSVNSQGEVRGALVEDNSSQKEAGGVSLQASAVDVVESVIRNNFAGLAGGGAHVIATTGGMFRNCLVYGNYSGLTTGGLLLEDGVSDFHNNVVAYNSAVYGGGGIMVSRGSIAQISQNVVYANLSGGEFTDGISAIENTPLVAWNNVATHHDGSGIAGSTCPLVDLAWNDAWGNGDSFLDWSGDADSFEGQFGNVSVDPFFVSLAHTGDILADDVHLAPSSPLVDAGDPGVLDPDGTRSDPGVFGGPYGASWDDLPADPAWAEGRPGCEGQVPACACVASDGDLDGFGDDPSCAAVDCDDFSPERFPGAPEVCDGVDDDCDGWVDDGYDIDADGYTTCGGDCLDSNAAVSPGAAEACNGVDDDCDAQVDEQDALGCSVYYSDSDGDGFGTGTGRCLCAPEAVVRAGTSGDCYDSNPNARPGQTGWFSASRGDGSFDFDCDGASAPRYPSTYVWNCGAFGCSMASSGWRDAVPACGAPGTFVTSCQGAMFVCSVRNTRSQVQLCH